MGIVRFLVPVLTCHEDKGWAKQNICIYNIVYVVYRMAVDGLLGLMFGGFTSRTSPFLVLLGWMCPSHSHLFLIVIVQHYGDWEDPACGAIEWVG